MEEIERELQLANAETAELRGRLVLQDLQRSLQQSLAQVTNAEQLAEARLAHRACSTTVNPTSVYENNPAMGASGMGKK
jgi:hypothetical protein